MGCLEMYSFISKYLEILQVYFSHLITLSLKIYSLLNYWDILQPSIWSQWVFYVYLKRICILPPLGIAFHLCQLSHLDSVFKSIIYPYPLFIYLFYQLYREEY